MKTTEFHGSESYADCLTGLKPAVGLKSKVREHLSPGSTEPLGRRRCLGGAGLGRGIGLLLLLIMILTSTGCGFLAGNRSGKSYVIKGQRYHILASANGFKEKGQASWYGEPFHGRKTASGEVYDMNKISAAHKTLPLHTWVEVRNLDNNKVMTVRINDRGPFIKGRIIDLSRGAAQEMGMLNAGLARVRIRAITGKQAERLAEAERQGNSVTAMAALPSTAPSAGAGIGEAQSYGVQALITSSSAEAEKHRKIVEKSFGAANINTRIDNGQTTFAVFVEGLKSKDEAAALQKSLTAKGYGAAQVIELTR